MIIFLAPPCHPLGRRPEGVHPMLYWRPLGCCPLWGALLSTGNSLSLPLSMTALAFRPSFRPTILPCHASVFMEALDMSSFCCRSVCHPSLPPGEPLVVCPVWRGLVGLSQSLPVIWCQSPCPQSCPGKRPSQSPGHILSSRWPTSCALPRTTPPGLP